VGRGLQPDELIDGTGSKPQEISIAANSRSTPVIDDGELFFGTRAGYVYAFE